MTSHALLLADALAVYAVFIAPWLADRKVRQLRAAGHPPDKTAVYRRAIGMQVVMISAVAELWLIGGRRENDTIGSGRHERRPPLS